MNQQFFEKYLKIKFHENPSCGSRNGPCGQTDGETRYKLIVGFHKSTYNNNSGQTDGQTRYKLIVGFHKSAYNNNNESCITKEKACVENFRGKVS